MALPIAKPSLAELREMIGATSLPARSRTSFSLYPQGFSVGTLVEVTGLSRTEFIALFLKENSQLKIAWIEETITINPYALKQKGVQLDNFLFVEGKGEIAWCISQVLSSGCFHVVVIENARWSEKDLRRFQLLSEKSQNHFFLLSTHPSSSWVPHLQLRVARTSAGWNIQSLRRRGAL